MNVIESKEFNEVMEYMKEYFQHSKHYLFSNTIDTVTKSDGKKYNSLYCFYAHEDEEVHTPGVALLWNEDRKENHINEVDGILFFECAMEYFMKVVDEDYDFRPFLSLSLKETSVKDMMPLIQAQLLSKIKVEDNSIDLYNEMQEDIKMWR